MKSRTAIYAGTFDPITLGHLDLVERALHLFDNIIVAVGTASGKETLFTLQERADLVKNSTKHLRNVSVDSFSGLLVDYAKKQKAPILLRGLRALSDFETEFQHATTNRKLAPNIETVFIMTSAKYFYLNSSIVKEVASLGGDISCFAPKPVETALRKKFNKQ